jgi:hypothetical protein
VTDLTKKLLALAAAGEAVMGLALLIVPETVAQLLLGFDDLAGISVVIARVAGIALVGLGASCWSGDAALSGMLTYSSLVALYLAYLGLDGEWVGVLLWPAVAFHAVLSALLANARLRHRPIAN